MTINQSKALISLKKANSLLTRVIKMTESQEYCVNIMQQNLAVIGLLRSAHQNLMEAHLKNCFSHAIKSNDEKLKQKMTEEILQVSKLSNK